MGSNQFLVNLDNAKYLILKVIEGPNLGETFTSQIPKGKSNIGRKGTNDISFPEDQHLSNMHSTIFSIEGIWYIEDLGTTNGYHSSDSAPGSDFPRKAPKANSTPCRMELSSSWGAA